MNNGQKFASHCIEAKILALASVSELWPQTFGLSWPRSAGDEPAAKKRWTSLFADYRTSHNAESKRTDDSR